MHYLEQGGTTPVVVFVHGYCQSSAYWAPTVDRLAREGVSCLALDLPGFAASAEAPGPYTMEAYADAIARLLDEKSISRIALVGGSMGGVVAQHFALRHPSRLVRLLLVATGAYSANPAPALAKAEALAVGAWNEDVVAPIICAFFHRPPSAARLAEFRKIAVMAKHQAAVDALKSNAQSRTFERLGEILVPTLIVQGRHDKGRTPEHGAEMCTRIPDARLAIVEGSGHTPQLEESDAFHDVALPFLLAQSSSAVVR